MIFKYIFSIMHTLMLCQASSIPPFIGTPRPNEIVLNILRKNNSPILSKRFDDKYTDIPIYDRILYNPKTTLNNLSKEDGYLICKNISEMMEWDGKEHDYLANLWRTYKDLNPSIDNLDMIELEIVKHETSYYEYYLCADYAAYRWHAYNKYINHWPDTPKAIEIHLIMAEAAMDAADGLSGQNWCFNTRDPRAYSIKMFKNRGLRSIKYIIQFGNIDQKQKAIEFKNRILKIK